MPKLTAKSIQALKDKGRYGDGEGLYLEVSRTGSKSWILRTTVQGGRQDTGEPASAQIGEIECAAHPAYWLAVFDFVEPRQRIERHSTICAGRHCDTFGQVHMVVIGFRKRPI